ncbi:hermansky-Pudlak syndrome 5 protein [Trichonephila clavipes]|nr:hermansky-Pudlak syndrome 5 protein [Trichonephila clavipes]
MASGGICPPRVSYILAELEDIDAVFVPIKTANRVKYTCFDVSRHYVVFGTNAGGVVFLQHDTLSYIKTVTAKAATPFASGPGTTFTTTPPFSRENFF